MSHSSFPGRISLFQPLEPRTLFSDNPPVIAPRNLTAVATSATAVKLHWTDLSVNETGFQVERSENFSTFEVVIITGPGATAWTDDDLSPGTQYTYRVRANSALTDSDYSGSSTVVTPPSSFADRDGSGTLFLHANTGIDTIIVTDTGSSIDVDVNGATASFDDTLEPVSKISLITADNDHSITVDNNGALTLKGNGQANDFVGLSGDDTVVNVKINGSVTTFSKTLVNRITVMTFVGADRISVSSAVGPVNVNGGDGNDTIFGGTGDDRLDGGKGDDLIKGEDGNDYITGGEGNDFLYGQNGADTLLGGNGDDKLVAGDGIDSVIGGDGRDRLYGTVNQDILKGGDGKDSIIQF